MKKLLELNATKSHYYYVMNQGHCLKTKLNQGTLTLIGVKGKEERYNRGYSVVNEYNYYCRACGWDFSSKNTFSRAGEQPMQCPNCGYIHRPEGTILTQNKDKIIPFYYKLCLYSYEDKMTLKMRYKNKKKEDKSWTAKETICFDFKHKLVVWHYKDKTTEKNLDIGYLDDDFKEASALACFTMDTMDDQGNTFSDLCQVMEKEANLQMKKCYKAKTRALTVKRDNTKAALFDTLLKIAHFVRFPDAPPTHFYGAKKTLHDWYADNNLYYANHRKFEEQLEKLIVEEKLTYYQAALKHFGIPDSTEMKRYFSYRNLGFYKKLKQQLHDAAWTQLVFRYAIKLPYGSYENTSHSLREAFVESMAFLKKTYPKIKPTLLETITNNLFAYVKDYSKMERQAVYIYRYGLNKNKQIVADVESDIAEELLTDEFQNIAKTTHKDFHQVLCEELGLLNVSLVRKCYAFQLLKHYQEIYTDFPDLKEANELIECSYNVYNNKAYNRHTRLKEFLQFYKAFKDIYPGIVTPTYAARYTLNNKNNPADCVNMLESLDAESLQKFLEEKPKLKSLHDRLMLLSNLQKNAEIEYHIPDNVIRRTEMYLKNTKLSVLTKYSELFMAGQELKNCAASYRNKINANHFLVLATDDKGKPQALIEIQDNAIVQAKLTNNIPVHKNPVIQQMVLEFAVKSKYDIQTTDIRIAPQDETVLSATA